MSGSEIGISFKQKPKQTFPPNLSVLLLFFETMLCRYLMCWWDWLSPLFPSARDLFTIKVHSQSSPICENREKPGVSAVLRLWKGSQTSQTLIFHWIIIVISHYYSWKTYCSSRVWAEPFTKNYSLWKAPYTTGMCSRTNDKLGKGMRNFKISHSLPSSQENML